MLDIAFYSGLALLFGSLGLIMIRDFRKPGSSCGGDR